MSEQQTSAMAQAVAEAKPSPDQKELIPAKKCNIEDVVPLAVLSLLKLAPTNPVIRTQVQSKIKVAIPDEQDTYDKIKDWIENNIDADKLKVAKSTNPNAIAININATVSDRERGNCAYTRHRRGRRIYSFTERVLLDMVQAAIRDGCSMDDLSSRFWERIDDCISGNMPDDMEQREFYTDEEEPDSFSNREWSTTQSLSGELRQWLSRAHPRLLDQLEGNAGTDDEDEVEPDPDERD